ncbi:MAG: DUF1592 domain-containing protein [Myxococcota bacterium]|nr:DUF1592 domain-containing protein [Myxococcota bacterium]
MTRPHVVTLLSLLLIAASACQSKEENPSNPPLELTDMAEAQSYSAIEAGAPSLRRLTQTQFYNSVKSVFGDEIVVPKLAEPDLSIGGLLSVGASTTTVTPRGVESLETVAYQLADQAISNEAIRSRVITCEPTGVSDENCMREIIEALGPRLWRRVLTNEELSQLVSLGIQSAGTLQDFDEGLTFPIAALIQSPNFMYRIELGTDGNFDAQELATRLSYFLWNTTPDAELLEAAANGELSTREGLFTQASRLLDSPKSRDGMRNFFSEQLKLYDVGHFQKDPQVFEHFTSSLGEDASEETLRLLEYIVFDEDGDYRDVMTTSKTFINRQLAALYDVPAPSAEEFSYVDLEDYSPRVGLLGHASILGLNAHVVSSSPTLRGKAVRNILLCQLIPAPPVNVDTSIPEPSGNTNTMRERVAEHLTDPSCAGCHRLTDPIGLGLENFDGIGRWRDYDNGEIIDPSGDLDGAEFVTPYELGNAIRNHRQFVPCVVRTLNRYATGRMETAEERAWLETLVERFEGHKYSFRALALEIVMSPFFVKAGTEGEVAQ